MYREDRANRQDRAYREGGMHPDDPAYREERPFGEDGMYREDAAYQRNGQYQADAGHQGNGRYSGDAAYQRNGQYQADAGYQGNGAYPADAGYQDNGRYAGDAGYQRNGQYQADAGYQGNGAYHASGGYQGNGEYQADAGYQGNGRYADDAGYRRNGQYQADAGYERNGRYQQDAAQQRNGQYGEDTAQLPNGQYAEAGYSGDDSYWQGATHPRSARYGDDDLYRPDDLHRQDAAFGTDDGLRDNGRYPEHDLYRESGLYPGDVGHRDEGPYRPDGAYGEDGMFRQAEPAVAARGAGGGGRRPRRRRLRSRRTRLILRVIAAIAATFLLITGWSVGHALTVPGGGTFSERLAEWARTHYLGPVVTFGEWLTYKPPVKGGKPGVSLNKLGGKVVRKKSHYHGIVPIIPTRVSSPAGPPLPGEGVWKAVVSVKGVPAVFKTYVRQSKTYSSYYAGIVSMDPRLLRFSLRPGTEDPGYGHWGVPMEIPPGHRLGLVATFNSGFRIYAAGGGFYLNGHYDGKLVPGAASEVYFRNGSMTIGVWGRGALHMGPNIAAVRQNLKPIVINGRVPASVNYNVESSWGATLGGGYYVWRSGVGITKDGRIVYVYGPALNVNDLAALLQRAGCVTAMELDINPDWMSFMYYLAKNHPGNPTPVNLLRNQIQPPARYYSLSNRDFTAVFAR